MSPNAARYQIQTFGPMAACQLSINAAWCPHERRFLPLFCSPATLFDALNPTNGAPTRSLS